MRTRRVFGLVLILTILGLSVCLAARFLGREPRESFDRARFVRSVQGERPVEGRLSWGFVYTRFREPTEVAIPKLQASGPKPVSGAVRGRAAAAREIEQAIFGETSPEALGAQGILQLFDHQTDRAVRDLERASRIAPNDARLLSDLIAALLARARGASDPQDLVKALASADKAVALDPKLPEAHFNRALALEKLFLLTPARAAWEDYLRLDAGSDWAGEARNHLNAVSQPSSAGAWNEMHSLLDKPDVDQQTVEEIVKKFPQEARQYAEDSLLGSWADHFLEGKQEQATQNLNAVRRIGATLAARFGEHMPADAAVAIDRSLSSKGSTAQVTALAEGHRAYRDGRLLDKQFRTPEARPLFDQAHRAFVRGQSPAEALALLYLAIGYYQQYRYGRAFQALEVCLSQETARGRHPGLLGRAYWLIGLMHLGNGEPSLSLTAYEQALSAMNRTGGAEGIAGVHAAMAETLRYLGQSREAWGHLYNALLATQSIGSSRRREAILTELAEICEAAGEWSVARYFLAEAVRIAEASKDPALYAQALLRSSQTQKRTGDESGAEARLVEARQTLNQIPDETLRRRTEADLLIAESAVRPMDSRDALTQALAFFEAKKNHFFVSGLLLARARANRFAGDEESAEEDLRRGIAEYELQRSRVGEEESKISFFDGAESLFHEMIRLQAVDFRRAGAALDFAERGKARALLDRLGSVTRQQKQEVIASLSEPLTSEEICQRLPDGIAILEYTLLEDRLLIWVIRRSGLEMEEISAGSRSVNALVEQLRTAIVGRHSIAEQAVSSALYDLVIRPTLQHIESRDTLVFVPDQGLHGVPFAALFDRDTRRYLIKDHVITVAPSATLAVEAAGDDHNLSSSSTALVVGNPIFRKELALQLGNLPQAEREAQEIRALLPGSEILTRESATKSKFLSSVDRHEVIHFGGHAIINQELPLLSYLALSPEGPKDLGLLYARELYSCRFKRCRLAVLSACSTASGPIHKEGVMNLARAFLAAGIPNVVASLWAVSDEYSPPLFHVFYQRLLQGVDSAGALREAQLAFLESSNVSLKAPASWAAFEHLGTPSLGYTPGGKYER